MAPKTMIHERGYSPPHPHSSMAEGGSAASPMRLSRRSSSPIRLSASQTLALQRGPASDSDSEDGVDATPTAAAATEKRPLATPDANPGGGGTAALLAQAHTEEVVQLKAELAAIDHATEDHAEGWGELIAAHERKPLALGEFGYAVLKLGSPPKTASPRPNSTRGKGGETLPASHEL